MTAGYCACCITICAWTTPRWNCCWKRCRRTFRTVPTSCRPRCRSGSLSPSPVSRRLYRHNNRRSRPTSGHSSVILMNPAPRSGCWIFRVTASTVMNIICRCQTHWHNGCGRSHNSAVSPWPACSIWPGAAWYRPPPGRTTSFSARCCSGGWPAVKGLTACWACS